MRFFPGWLLGALCLASAPVVAAPQDDFDRCLSALQPQARKQGISAIGFTRFTAGLAPDLSVLPLLDAQPEFTTPLWDYLAALVDSQRVDDGRARLTEHRDLLNKVSAQYGVDPATIVAVWGVESDYGRVFGKRPLLQSLATLSCNGRRQPFFRKHASACPAEERRAQKKTGPTVPRLSALLLPRDAHGPAPVPIPVRSAERLPSWVLLGYLQKTCQLEG